MSEPPCPGGCLAKPDDQQLLPTFHRDSKQENSLKSLSAVTTAFVRSCIPSSCRLAVAGAGMLKGVCLFYSAELDPVPYVSGKGRSLATPPAPQLLLLLTGKLHDVSLGNFSVAMAKHCDQDFLQKKSLKLRIHHSMGFKPMTTIAGSRMAGRPAWCWSSD